LSTTARQYESLFLRQNDASRLMTPRPLLHLEGAAVLLASLFAYHSNHGSWLTFALLFLVPDVSMLGYAVNTRVGAIAYNAVHSYVAPLILAVSAFGTNHAELVSLSLIWIAHIGFDRMLGYGLKYPTRFKDTHLNPDRHVAQILIPATVEPGARNSPLR
jgi:hypothetical protein